MIVHSAYPLDVRVARESRVAVDHGFDVDVIALREPGEAKHEVVDGVRVFRLPVSHRRGAGVPDVLREYLGFTALASARSLALAARHRYSVVHVHNPPDFLIASALMPRLLGARVILDIHDLSPDMFAMRFEGLPGAAWLDRALRSIERWATRCSDVVITVHEPYRRELLARDVPREKTVVVMNSLDERLLPPGGRPESIDGFRVVYHGTITPPYGVELVVEAAAQLVDSIDDLRIEIYGEGDSLPAICERAAELGVAERMYASGRYLPQASVLERVQLASVGVIPNLATRLNRFALSSKLFEYVALGIPVVCADLPTIREHFSDEEVLFFRAGDARALAGALRAVAEQPEEADARAERALERYRRNYTWRANGQVYADVLTQLVTDTWPPGRAGSARALPTWRPAVAAAESTPGEAATFGVSEPFLFFDHFRIPNRRVSIDELAGEEASEPLALREFAQLAWLGSDPESQSRRLFWVSSTADGVARAMLPLTEYRLGSIPIFARMLPDHAAAARLQDGWRPTETITDESGVPVASIWRDERGNVFLPFDPSEVIQSYWSEAYRTVTSKRLARHAWTIARRGYYRLRPAVPRSAQLAMRRLISHLQTRSTFPRWPVEPALNDFLAFLFRMVGEIAPEPVPWLAPWPKEFDWALVLTHDVESPVGFGRVHMVCELERSLGYRSSWNFVPMSYVVTDDDVATLTESGFEVGVHGLYHDGRLFESYATFTERLPAIRRHAERWGAVGFRSPATHRIWSWMPELDFEYDSSYPDTDPFEPYAGGCCSWLPYFNEGLIELPITLPQDHTLFRILGHTDESLWVEKIDRLKRAGGMALMLTHPDYMVDPSLQRAYTRVLERYADDTTVWRALPRQVSDWWRRRFESRIEWSTEGWRVVGPAAGEARINYVPAGARAVACGAGGVVAPADH